MSASRRFQRAEKVVHKAIDLGGREPPNSPSDEAAVLSAILSDDRKLDIVAPILAPEDFFGDSRRRIYSAAIDLRQRGIGIDVQTVASWLKDRDWLEGVGGISYIANLLDSTAAVAHPVDYARKVRLKARRRKIIETAQIVAAEGHAWTGDDEDFFGDARGRLTEALEDHAPVDAVSLADATTERLSEIREVWAGRLDPAGMQTRFCAYNALTGGLFPAQNHVVAALTNGGKSAWAWECCLDVAGTEFQGDIVGCVAISAEMPRGQLVDRGLSLATVPRRRFLVRDPAADVSRAVELACDDLAGKPIHIIDRPCTIDGVRAAIRNAQRAFDRARRPGQSRTRVRFVLVDYLQIMRLPDGRELRERIGAFTTAMKHLAIELGVHIMIVSQLTREPGKGARRPTLFDLKESGSIENDADLVTFIHRPIETVEVEERRGEDWSSLEDYAELVLAKARENAKGKYVEVAFDGPRTRFDEPTVVQIDRWKRARAALKSRLQEAPAHTRRGPYDAKPGTPRPPHAA